MTPYLDIKYISSELLNNFALEFSNTQERNALYVQASAKYRPSLAINKVIQLMVMQRLFVHRISLVHCLHIIQWPNRL